VASSSSISPPSALVQGVAQTNQAIPQIDQAVAALVALPTPDGSALASLPGDVNKARSDAAEWTTTYRSLVLSTLQSVVDWNTTFNSYYGQLQTLAAQIAQSDSSAVAPFQAILEHLQTAAQGMANTTDAVAKQLVTFETLIDSDIATLNADQAQLETVQKNDEAAEQTDEAQEQNLQNQLKQQQDRMRDLALIPFAGPLLAGLDSGIKLLTGQVQTEANDINAEQSAASSAGQAASAAGADAGDAKTAGSDLGAIASGVGSLDTGWNVLDSNFAELISSEDITTYDVFTPALLEATQSDWNNLAAQAASLLPPAAPAE
jgi:hypothetical protein